MNLVDAFLPKVLLLENVAGIIYSEKDEAYQYICERLRSINGARETNYIPVPVKLNAADYGVPQKRERVFIVSRRDGEPFQPPKPTHAPPGTIGENGHGRLKPHVTAWDAIGHLHGLRPDENLAPQGYWGDLLKSIPEGKNYLWHTPRNAGKGKAEDLFGWRTRYWSFLLKLAKDKPSWTLQASPGPATGPFHWSNRRLSRAELCRLQTFPEDWVQHCATYRTAVRQVGNSVPPAIGELLGYEIRKQLLHQDTRLQLKLAPKKRDDCLRRSPVRPVDPKYHKHKGDHTDHGGKGMGPRAVNQGRGEQ